MNRPDRSSHQDCSRESLLSALPSAAHRRLTDRPSDSGDGLISDSRTSRTDGDQGGSMDQHGGMPTWIPRGSSEPLGALKLSADEHADATPREVFASLSGSVGLLLVCACVRVSPSDAPLAQSISRDEFHSCLGTLSPLQEIIVYCLGCPGDICARTVVRALRDGGYVVTRVLRGGMTAWVDAGLPLKA